MGGDDEEEEDDVEEHQDEDGQVEEEEGLVPGGADEAGHVADAGLVVDNTSCMTIQILFVYTKNIINRCLSSCNC